MADTSDKISFSPTEALGLAQNLPAQNQNNLLQGVLTSGAQPRPGHNNPNVVLPPAGASTSTPQHVQAVTANITKSSDVTTKITVSYKRNPNDPLFVDAKVFVSGYNGNPSPVQVAQGQSPLSVSLNNTGEAVKVTVQANGNTGAASIGGAPTTAISLPRTPLATTPTTAGNGTGSSTLVMPAEFIVTPSGSVITVTKATETAHTVWASASSGSSSAQPAFRKLVPADLPIANRFGVRVFTGGNTLFNQGVQSSSAIGTASAVTATSTEPYYLGLASSASAGSSAGIVEGTGSAYPLTLGCFLQYETRIQLLSTANIRVWIGLFDGTAGISGAALRSDNPIQNLVAFRYSTAASDTKWQMYTATDATHFTATGTGSTPDTNGHVFGITYDGTNANFYIDRVLVGSQATNLPATSQGLHFFVSIDNVGLANSKSVNVAYGFVDTI